MPAGARRARGLPPRAPAGLDYSTLQQLGYILGKLFWADIEQHHPGISGLHLPDDVARAWKQRLQVKEHGGTDRSRADRLRPCLTNVRAFYLDLAQWALDDPSRWAQWAVPCPVRPNETISRKMTQHRKSRMDARTRERLPVLPALVSAAAQPRGGHRRPARRGTAGRSGQEFTAAGRTLVRLPVKGGSPFKVWARDPVAGRRADLTGEEDYAFWAWAAIEVLRHTGIRIEELLELSHHSLVQYRLPGTGELVPLLQVIPVENRRRTAAADQPRPRRRPRRDHQPRPRPVRRHPPRRRLRPPRAPLDAAAPRCCSSAASAATTRPSHDRTVRRMLAAAVTRAGLADPATGQPLAYTPHDFRRMFITDAVLNGLPPHIAQVIAGHRDINVTMGYKAVYPDEAIQAHRAFLARRRALRPGEEYRAPTDEEWQQFLGHFERRKVATGTCGRAFATPCPHEHACIRCPMLWPDPAQKQRLTEIRDNLTARIAEAEREGWHGETEGLKISLAGAEDKLTQITRRPTVRQTSASRPSGTDKRTAKRTKGRIRQVQRIACQQRRHVPARMTRAEHPVYEHAGNPRPLRQPRERHALPNRHPSHQRTALPPPRPRGQPGGRADTGDTRPTPPRTSSRKQPRRAARPWPSVKTQTVRTDRPTSPRRRPLYVRGRRNPTATATTR